MSRFIWTGEHSLNIGWVHNVLWFGGGIVTFVGDDEGMKGSRQFVIRSMVVGNDRLRFRHRALVSHRIIQFLCLVRSGYWEDNRGSDVSPGKSSARHRFLRTGVTTLSKEFWLREVRGELTKMFRLR